MENKVVGYIPKLLFRFYLTLKERFDPTPPIPKEEQFCIDICKKLISNPDSKLTFAPLSNKRFIKYEKEDMFIIMESHTINLINHVYSYNIYIQNSGIYGELIQTFDKKLEEERQEIENEIRGNIQHSLGNILNKLGD